MVAGILHPETWGMNSRLDSNMLFEIGGEKPPSLAEFSH